MTPTATQHIDSTAEDITEPGGSSPPPPDQPPAPPAAGAPDDGAPGGALAVLEGHAGAIIRADEPDEILVKAHVIAKSLAKLIEDAGLAKSLDRRNPDRKHVEVGGWQATGALLGSLGGQPLHAETIWTRPARDPATGEAIRRTYTVKVTRYHPKDRGGGVREVVEYEIDGYDWEACVEIRTPGGVVVGRAEAMCSRSEDIWSKRDEYAVRSMAETRAESRAYRRAIGWIVHLAGYNPTPAEEMGHTPGAGGPAAPTEMPPWTVPAEGDLLGQARKAIAALLGLPTPSHQAVDEVLAKVAAKADGHVPAIAAKAIGIAAGAWKAAQTAREAGDAQREGAAAPERPTADDPSLAEQLERQMADYGDAPAPGSLAEAPIEQRVAQCTCKAGFEVADADPAAQATDCPVHGIPF